MRKLGIIAATVLAAGAIGSASAQTITYTVDCSKGQTIWSAIEGTPESRWSCSFEERVTST